MAWKFVCCLLPVAFAPSALSIFACNCGRFFEDASTPVSKSTSSSKVEEGLEGGVWVRLGGGLGDTRRWGEKWGGDEGGVVVRLGWGDREIW